MNFGSPSIAFFPMQASLQCADFTLLLFCFSSSFFFLQGRQRVLDNTCWRHATTTWRWQWPCSWMEMVWHRSPAPARVQQPPAAELPLQSTFFYYFVTIDTIFFLFCFVLGFLYFWINLNSDPEVGVEKEHLWYFVSLGCHSCNSDVFSCVSVKCEHPFPKSRTYWWNQNHYLEVIHCLLCYFFHLQLDMNLNCGFWLWLLSHPWFMLTNVFIIDAVPKRRRPARSIFDGFRDFQTETSKCLYIYYVYIYIYKF